MITVVLQYVVKSRTMSPLRFSFFLNIVRSILEFWQFFVSQCSIAVRKHLRQQTYKEERFILTQVLEVSVCSCLLCCFWICEEVDHHGRERAIEQSNSSMVQEAGGKDEEKGPWSQHSCQEHMPSYLTSFPHTPSLKGSTTSQ